MKRNYLASRLDSIQQSFPLPGKKKRNKNELQLPRREKKKKRLKLIVLAFDELLLLHQDQRDCARVAHRPPISNLSLGPPFHYRSR